MPAGGPLTPTAVPSVAAGSPSGRTSAAVGQGPAPRVASRSPNPTIVASIAPASGGRPVPRYQTGLRCACACRLSAKFSPHTVFAWGRIWWLRVWLLHILAMFAILHGCEQRAASSKGAIFTMPTHAVVRCKSNQIMPPSWALPNVRAWVPQCFPCPRLASQWSPPALPRPASRPRQPRPPTVDLFIPSSANATILHLLPACLLWGDCSSCQRPPPTLQLQNSGRCPPPPCSSCSPPAAPHPPGPASTSPAQHPSLGPLSARRP
jgi:hypothetical protein